MVNSNMLTRLLRLLLRELCRYKYCIFSCSWTSRENIFAALLVYSCKGRWQISSLVSDCKDFLSVMEGEITISVVHMYPKKCHHNAIWDLFIPLDPQVHLSYGTLSSVSWMLPDLQCTMPKTLRQTEPKYRTST